MATKAVWFGDKENPLQAAKVAIEVMRKYKGKATKTPACIFDIDETLLKNSENYTTVEDEYSVQHCGKAIFDHCVKENIVIFLVTARRKSKEARDFARRQLSDLGYNIHAVKGIYMTSKEFDELDDAGAEFKEAARKKICKEYSVILNCGDRWTDVCSPKEAKRFEEQYDSDVYIGIRPKSDIMHAVKFPEFD